MHSVTDLINDLSTRQDPMLTWYGPDGERVDLSGKTAANWMIKATNLLTMELGADEGGRFWLDLPVHWRTVVWAVAVWASGGEVCLRDDEVDAVITSSPSADHAGLDQIVVALPALARKVEDLPADAIDGAADLMTQADSFMFPPAGSPSSETGFGQDQATLLSTDLGLDPAKASAPLRILIGGEDLPGVLRAVLSSWARGHSVVLTQDETVAAAEAVTHIKHFPS